MAQTIKKEVENAGNITGQLEFETHLRELIYREYEPGKNNIQSNQIEIISYAINKEKSRVDNTVYDVEYKIN